MKILKAEAPWLVTLILLAAFLWAITYDRVSTAKWGTPVEYLNDIKGGDAVSCLAYIQAASEWNQIPFLNKEVDRLGAPYTANWNDFPSSEEFPILFMGIATRWLGLFEASNLALMLVHVTAALAFYCSCRLMRFRRLWSWVCAILFATAYYHFYRGLGHILMSFTFTVPLAIVSAWLITASRRLAWGNKLGWFCIGVAIVMGVSNPYNLNLYGQLICLGLAVQIWFRRRKPNLQIGVACLAISGICFFASNLDTFSYGWKYGKNAGALARGYYETELFALKPIELIIPPVSHKIDALARIGSKYLNVAWIKGEVFSPYLGAVCTLALIWMAYEALTLLAGPRARRSRFPAYLPQVLWVFVYAVVGGLNCVIGLLGIPLFRGSNRFSVFLSALALLFLASRLSRLTRTWSLGQKLALAGGLLVVACYDQLPLPTPSIETANIAQWVRVDREFCKSMEANLKPGAMVFQLPVMPFPEANATGNMQAYEHMRPFFYTKTLRFSFGSDKGRAREDWQKEVEKLPPAQMAQALERYGFGAIYINRRGYQDRAESILKALAEGGYKQVIEDALQDQVCVLLNPAAAPILPPAGDRIVHVLGSGWVRDVDSPAGIQHWTAGSSDLSFFNPEKASTRYNFSAQVGSLTPQRVSIEINGREVWGAMLPGNQITPAQFGFDARPGNNKVVFRTDTPVRPTRNNPLPQAFVVVKPQILPAK